MAGEVAMAGTCARDIEILGAQATFRTRLVHEKPVRRDAELKITVRSTATTAVSSVELAVFLGARLTDVSTLHRVPPTQDGLKRLPSGGLVFRTEVPTQLPPGATRVLAFTQPGLPLDRDVYGVTARVVRCRRLIPVGSATVDLPPHPDPWVAWLYAAALIFAVIAGVVVLRRLR